MRYIRKSDSYVLMDSLNLPILATKQPAVLFCNESKVVLKHGDYDEMVAFQIKREANLRKVGQVNTHWILTSPKFPLSVLNQCIQKPDYMASNRPFLETAAHFWDLDSSAS